MGSAAAVVATAALQAGEQTLLVAGNKAGYFGVHLDRSGKPKPYQARVWRGGKYVYLGSFAPPRRRRCASRVRRRGRRRRRSGLQC